MAGEKAEHSNSDIRSNATDIHVGSRIRLRRILLKMPQERLGHALGLTFQQIQKYERGTNRVSASRLFDISRILDVSISYFFDEILEAPEDASTSVVHQSTGSFSEPASAFNASIDKQLARRETIELVSAYYQIPDPAIRNRMLELIKSLSSSKPNAQDST